MDYQYEISEHDRAAQSIFGDPVPIHPTDAPLDCVLMAFVNRSGSNYLGELLCSTGEFTGFEESLNAFTLTRLSEMYDSKDFESYIRRLQKEQLRRSSKSWGLKVGWQQLAMLLRYSIIPTVMRPTVLCVKRRDVVGQAISLFVASNTLQWKRHLDSQSEAEALPEVAYDSAEILKHMRGVMNSYAMMDQILVLAGLPIIRCYYEDLIDHPLVEVATITERLTGRAMMPVESQITLQVQRDDKSQAFRERFLSDLRSLKWSL